jgi:uncharacterized protein with NRDE domain
MCIALISTAHPAYRLILIDNRDEYLNRPTDPARWWPEPDHHVLGGRDMLRDVHGTWLGVTRSGKVAVLTNFREEKTPIHSPISRGAIIKKFLTESVGGVEAFVKDVVNTGIAKDAGGFSLVCGHVGEKLAVISNRAEDHGQVPWIAGDIVHTVGLSNTTFTDHSWKKVTTGEEYMQNAIRSSIENNDDEDQLIQRLLQVLSHDTLPRTKEADEAGLQGYLHNLRDTILVPAIGCRDTTRLTEDEMRASKGHEKIDVVGYNSPVPGDGSATAPNHKHKILGVNGLYGTQKQTIVLADKDMNVRFFERTLYDEQVNLVPPGKGDVDVRFRIED